MSIKSNNMKTYTLPSQKLGFFQIPIIPKKQEVNLPLPWIPCYINRYIKSPINCDPFLCPYRKVCHLFYFVARKV